MTDEHERFRDELAAHAIGALDPPDRTGLERHLRGCAASPRLLAEHRAVFDLLPLALASASPLPGARAALLARTREPSTAPTRRAAPTDQHRLDGTRLVR